MKLLPAPRLPALLDALARRGYALMAPVLRDSAVTFGEIRSVDDLPAGWHAEPSPGRYRLVHRDDGALFGCTVGAGSVKRWLFPPEEALFHAGRNGDGLTFTPAAPDSTRRAFLGVRTCDLAAVAVQDRVFLEREGNPTFRPDPRYRARREAAFFVAVQCTEPSATCFCASMGTGPAVEGTAAEGAADLVLTELTGADHRFTVEAGTEAGREVLAELPVEDAPPEDATAVRAALQAAAQGMGRSLDRDAAVAVLRDNPEHPHWDEVTRRCLTCGNCTLVCPTCFCHTVVDGASLDGAEATRTRRWDSCFNVDHAYLHGGSVRTSPRSRYRQWLTHKLSTWVDQFGTPGCVGCGRCIAWCPTGIDLTEEVAALARRPEG